MLSMVYVVLSLMLLLANVLALALMVVVVLLVLLLCCVGDVVVVAVCVVYSGVRVVRYGAGCVSSAHCDIQRRRQTDVVLSVGHHCVVGLLRLCLCAVPVVLLLVSLLVLLSL